MKVCITDEDKEAILSAIKNETPFVITTYKLTAEKMSYVNSAVSFFFSSLGMEEFIDHVTYCIQELATNAKKANTKRVYFKERGLNLFDDNQYEQGMKDFKEETLSNIAHYLALQEEQNLYIKISMQKKGDEIILETRNNCLLTKFESIRILEKLEHSKHIASSQEAFDQILDNSEGAGLGIIIMMLMLKKSGINEDNLTFIQGKDETIARLKINIEQKPMSA